jgi:hypothetical protein
MVTINKREEGCFICGRNSPLERHHIFGAANRKLSEQDGLVVYLCRSCHNEPPDGVHFNKEKMEFLHKWGQDRWELRKMSEDHVTREEARKAFMKRYGRNYIYYE